MFTTNYGFDSSVKIDEGQYFLQTELSYGY